MRQLAETIAKNLSLSENELRKLISSKALFLRRKTAYYPGQDKLLIVADYRQLISEKFTGEGFALPDGCYGMICPLESGNIALLQTLLEPLNIRPAQAPLSFGTFEAGCHPLFRAETQEELEQIVLNVFRSGQQNGFSVTSAALNGKDILPFLVPVYSETLPDERQRQDYADHTFVLDGGRILFLPEMLSRCTQKYSRVLHCLSSCRKQAVLALPEDAVPEELLFINRELWLLKAKLPFILLPQNADMQLFAAVNRTYGKGELLKHA